MHLTLNALQNRALSFTENFFSSITAQQKRILVVATLALSSMTALYLIWRGCCFTAKEIKTDLDDDTRKVDQQKETISPKVHKVETPKASPTKTGQEKKQSQAATDQIELEKEQSPAKPTVEPQEGKKAESELEEVKKEELQEIPEEEIVRDEKTQNILLIGRSRSGKTTLINLLEEVCQVVGMGSLFYATREPELHELELSDYRLRVVDTPGLCEYAQKGKTQRTNEEIVQLIKEKAKEFFGGKEFEQVDTVLMTFTVESGINSGDMMALETFLPLLPQKTKKILVITHAECYSNHDHSSLRSQLSQHARLSVLINTYFRGAENILFTGALDEHDLNLEQTTTRKLRQIHFYREALIRALLPNAEPADLRQKRLDTTTGDVKVFLEKHFPKKSKTVVPTEQAETEIESIVDTSVEKIQDEEEAEKAKSQEETEPTLEALIESFEVDEEEQVMAEPTLEGYLSNFNTPIKAPADKTAAKKDSE
jgi:GTP-binding protein EngB required for normal cell division